uniref:NADH dehydrogenase [ubiquinone] 1 alpha subcomplex subunit 6 n=1 Tax=Brassica campestris TaxID=3711 RepID=M4F121_BRACM
MAAPFTLRKIGVPPNSANLTEARRRVFDFFRAACRSLPTVMDIYNLQDVVAPSQLRFAISAQIRNNAHVTDPKALPLISVSLVIDLLLFKGMEELTDIVDHAKQRHHIIGQYVVGEGLVQNTGSKDQGKSDFLKNFYTSNYV